MNSEDQNNKIRHQILQKSQTKEQGRKANGHRSLHRRREETHPKEGKRATREQQKAEVRRDNNEG